MLTRRSKKKLKGKHTKPINLKGIYIIYVRQFMCIRLFGSALDFMEFFNVTMPRSVQEQISPDRIHRL